MQYDPARYLLTPCIANTLSRAHPATVRSLSVSVDHFCCAHLPVPSLIRLRRRIDTRQHVVAAEQSHWRPVGQQRFDCPTSTADRQRVRGGGGGSGGQQRATDRCRLSYGRRRHACILLVVLIHRSRSGDEPSLCQRAVLLRHGHCDPGEQDEASGDCVPTADDELCHFASENKCALSCRLNRAT